MLRSHPRRAVPPLGALVGREPDIVGPASPHVGNRVAVSRETPGAAVPSENRAASYRDTSCTRCRRHRMRRSRRPDRCRRSHSTLRRYWDHIETSWSKPPPGESGKSANVCRKRTPSALEWRDRQRFMKKSGGAMTGCGRTGCPSMAKRSRGCGAAPKMTSGRWAQRGVGGG